MVLQVEGTAVSYDGVPAVAEVSFEVAAGEIVALLGPSGCGKSSLLRAVAGLEPLAAGRVVWDGDDMVGVPVHRRGFGLLFQDGQLFAHRNVARNVAYGLEAGGVARGERASRVAEVLALVGLEGFERRDVATLSGGQRQRVALARALAPHPRLLLLDEPLSALDRALRERLADDVRRVLVSTGTTALYVTHDQDEAFAVADRVGIMLPGAAGGRLARLSDPVQLWREPGSREAAEFLGYQAFLPDGDDWIAVGRGGLRAIPVTSADGQGAREAGDAPALSGTVVAARLRDGRVELSVDTDLGPDAERAAGSGRLIAVAEGDAPHPGDRVGLELVLAGCARVPRECGVARAAEASPEAPGGPPHPTGP